MKTSFSVVLLAGGKSRRMGKDKRMLPWTPTIQGRPQTILQHVIARASELTDDIIVVTNDSLNVAPARPVTDIYPDCGSLGGIYSGLMSISNSLAFVAAALHDHARPCFGDRVPEREGVVESHAAGVVPQRAARVHFRALGQSVAQRAPS